LERESKTSKVLYTIKSIVSWVILAVVVFLIATIFISRINGKTPTVMGYSFFRVSSESMLPTLEVGDIILVKECEITDLKVEDIVTYNGTKGNMAGKIITHRVVEAPYEKNGKTFVITCGDANDLNDPKVGAEQIIGIIRGAAHGVHAGELLAGIGLEESFIHHGAQIQGHHSVEKLASGGADDGVRRNAVLAGEGKVLRHEGQQTAAQRSVDHRAV